MKVETSPSNRTRCMRCKQVILKKEGRLAFGSGYKKVYYCYECALKYFSEQILAYKLRSKDLHKKNHIGKTRRIALKTAREL